MSKTEKYKLFAQNRKVRFNYTIEEVFEAGISLLGWEVKSIRAGGADISDSYVGINDNGMTLFKMNITPYKFSSYRDKIDPSRNRILLMHKKEIVKISTKLKKTNKTIVPTRLYLNNRQKIKIEIAIVVGKKLYDKRADIKERDLKRESRRKNFADN